MINVTQEVIEHIHRSFLIPPRPELLAELRFVMDAEEPGILDVAKVIEKDIAMSSMILKLINSPTFGLVRTVSDIKQGVMFLGLEGVYSLVQGVLLKEAFGYEPPKRISEFWNTAEDIAHVAYFLGGYVKSIVPAEQLYTLGLFHDCGALVLGAKYEDYEQLLLVDCHETSSDMVVNEEQRYQTNHAIVGYFIATSWYLPKELCKLILRHHDLDFLKQDISQVEAISYAILKLSEQMVSCIQHGKPAPDWEYVKTDALDAIGLTEMELADISDDIADLIGTP